MKGGAVELSEQALARSQRCHERCLADAGLMRRLRAVRAWQAQRLAATYEDLHRDPGFRGAVEFFLADLYGPGDFTARDEAFARAWPHLRKLMPAGALEVLASVLELHALTLELDSAMAGVLAEEPISAASYLRAYRLVGDPARRSQQIELIVGIGRHLAGVVKRPWVSLALLAAHAPAHAAGFGALQGFLERGYEAFRAVRDTGALLEAIESRETRLMRALFASGDAPALALLERRGSMDG